MRTFVEQTATAATASRESTMAKSAALLAVALVEEVVAPDDRAEGSVGFCEKRVLPLPLGNEICHLKRVG